MISPDGFATISVHGVPRSGTSWLGQILNSHPNVAYRHQPLFSRRFKAQVGPHSSAADWRDFVQKLYRCRDDDFLNDKWTKERELPFEPKKREPESTLVMKMVRYHHLIAKFLEWDPAIRVVGIVRHPCAVISSWLNAPREFLPTWCAEQEWRQAPSKNRGLPEEFNGFEKWLEVAEMFLSLDSQDNRFHLIRYEDLVSNPIDVTDRLLQFCGLRMEDQVLRFLDYSQSQDRHGTYSLIKSPSVVDQWQTQLDETIRDAILGELDGTEVGRRFA